MPSRATETTGNDLRLQRLEDEYHRRRSALYGGLAVVGAASMVPGRKLVELGPPYAWIALSLVCALVIGFAFLFRRLARFRGDISRERDSGAASIAEVTRNV
jgi:hypothetical protein